MFERVIQRVLTVLVSDELLLETSDKHATRGTRSSRKMYIRLLRNVLLPHFGHDRGEVLVIVSQTIIHSLIRIFIVTLAVVQTEGIDTFALLCLKISFAKRTS